MFTKYPELLREEGRIVNLDESPIHSKLFTTSTNSNSVYCFMTKEESKGIDVISTTGTTGNEKNITVLMAYGNDGLPACPSAYMLGKQTIPISMIQNVPQIIENQFQPVTMFTGEKGYNSQNKHYRYLSEQLIPHWRNKKFPTGPLMLLYDGATCHRLQAYAQQMIVDHNIILVQLLPNTSLVCQPLDKGVFGSQKGIHLFAFITFFCITNCSTIAKLQKIFRNIVEVSNCRSGLKKLSYNCLEVQDNDPEDFNPILARKYFDTTVTVRNMIWASEVAKASITPNEVKRGWKCTGIYPFNETMYVTWLTKERTMRHKIGSYYSARQQQQEIRNQYYDNIASVVLDTSCSRDARVKRVTAITIAKAADLQPAPVDDTPSNVTGKKRFRPKDYFSTVEQLSQQVKQKVDAAQESFVQSNLAMMEQEEELEILQIRRVDIDAARKQATTAVKSNASKEKSLQRKISNLENAANKRNLSGDDKKRHNSKMKEMQLSLKAIVKAKRAQEKEVKNAEKKSKVNSNKQAKLASKISKANDNITKQSLKSTFELDSFNAASLLGDDCAINVVAALPLDKREKLVKQVAATLEPKRRCTNDR